MNKYYRVKKDNFLWEEGAILVSFDKINVAVTPENKGYEPIEDIWNSTPVNGPEYISARIIEHPNNTDYFERVYPDTILGKFYYTKDQLVTKYKEAFKPTEKEVK